MGDYDLFDRLVKTFQETTASQTAELKKHIQTDIAEVKAELASIKTFIEEESQKRVEFENKQKNLERKCDYLEKAVKKNNILIFGLENIENENAVVQIISKLNALLELSLTLSDFNNIFPIGKPDKNNRPVVVQFVSYLTKLQVLKRCRKLKGSGISISEDLTQEERKSRNILAKHRDVVRAKGYRAYISRDKLYINGVKYTAEELVTTKVTTSDANHINLKIIESKRLTNSAPSTPSHNSFSDIIVDEEEIEANQEEVIIEEEEENVIQQGSNNIAISIDRESIQPQKSPVGDNKKKRKPTHTSGPVTRRFKRITRVVSHGNKLTTSAPRTLAPNMPSTSAPNNL